METETETVTKIPKQFLLIKDLQTTAFRVGTLFFALEKPTTKAEIMEISGFSPMTVFRALEALENLGVVERHGRINGNGKQVYKLRPVGSWKTVI